MSKEKIVEIMTKRNTFLLVTGVLLVSIFVVWRVFYYPLALARAELSESPPLSAIMNCLTFNDSSREDERIIYYLNENLTEELLHIIKQGRMEQPCKCATDISVEIQFKNGKTVSFKMSTHRVELRGINLRIDTDKFDLFLQRVKETEPGA